MSVKSDNGNKNDYSLGLIACSRHQSNSLWPSAQHDPKLVFEVDVVDDFLDWLKENVGVGVTRWERLDKNSIPEFITHVQHMGHTALFVREGGIATWARGWVPDGGFLNDIRAYFDMKVQGKWDDKDLDMMNDQTCISLEYAVGKDNCKWFMSRFEETYQKLFKKYCTSVGDDSCNCVWFAVESLRHFFKDISEHEILSRLDLVTSCKQGILMKQILDGSLLEGCDPWRKVTRRR